MTTYFALILVYFVANLKKKNIFFMYFFVPRCVVNACGLTLILCHFICFRFSNVWFMQSSNE